MGVSRNPVEIRDYNGTGDWTVEGESYVMRYVNCFERCAV
jgi:hypothetical protein